MAMIKGRHEEKNAASLSTHRAREFTSLVSTLRCCRVIDESHARVLRFAIHIVAASAWRH